MTDDPLMCERYSIYGHLLTVVRALTGGPS